MKKYIDIIHTINLGLTEFSDYLNPKYKIAPLSVDITDSKFYLDLTFLSWEDGRFPNSGNAGVYFMLARKEDDINNLGLYIGKASHNSFIGARLYSHLFQPKKADKIYPITDKKGQKFYIECVTSIAMDDIHFLAPALEEFLIYFLQNKKIHIINSIGKS